MYTDLTSWKKKVIKISIVYTIGYTAFPSIETYLEVLSTYNVNCVIDVRSSPFSQYYEIFNKSVLSTTLRGHKILYRNYDREFGARQHDKEFFHSDGYLDFNKFITSTYFSDGASKIKKGIDLNFNFALMCAEQDPIQCHRGIMIGRGLCRYGLQVEHILKNKQLESQEILEERLLSMYFEDRDQFSLFNQQKSDGELLEAAYNLKNREIGYKEEEF